MILLLKPDSGRPALCNEILNDMIIILDCALDSGYLGERDEIQTAVAKVVTDRLSVAILKCTSNVVGGVAGEFNLAGFVFVPIGRAIIHSIKNELY